MHDDLFLDYEDFAKCSGKRVAVDVETTGLFWYRDSLIGVGLYCPDAGVHGYFPTPDDDSKRAAMDAIREWGENTVFIAHNLKFELHFLRLSPTKRVGWKFIDTPLLVQFWDSRMRKSLEICEKTFLGTASKREHVTNAPARTPIWQWPLRVVADYCRNDCLVTYQLAEKLVPMVRELGLWKVYLKDIEYMKAIWEMEEYGFLIDDDFIDRAKVLQAATMQHLQSELWDACGHEFNWRSTKQLSAAIYEGLGILKPKNPFAGSDGVDRSRFADAGLYKSVCTSTFLLVEKVHHPLGELIAALRESARMLKTLQQYQDLAGGNRAVHPNFNQTVTRTHRLSSTKPNAQNVPSIVRGRFTQSVYSGDTTRTAEYNLRNAFIARPGKVLLSVDYKQMEMRMFGILAQDAFMLKALADGMDIHAYIADKVWGVVDKVHREWSKTIGFGLIYGMTIGSLMFKLNMDKTQAAKIRDQYLAAFPRIMPWMNEVIAFCQSFGFVRYWNGKIWREDQKIDMYKGANAQIQGGCAEVLSVATLRVNDWIQSTNPTDYRLQSLVHDEIMVEVPKEDVMVCAENMMRIMEIPDLFPVPFFNDAKAGPTYGSQEKLYGQEKYQLVAGKEDVIDTGLKDLEDTEENWEDDSELEAEES